MESRRIRLGPRTFPLPQRTYRRSHCCCRQLQQYRCGCYLPGAHRRMEKLLHRTKRNCNGKSHCSRQSFYSVYPFLTDSGTERNINEEKPFIIKINIRIVSHSNLIMYICRALSILIEEQYYFSNFIRMVTNVEMFIFIRFLIA